MTTSHEHSQPEYEENLFENLPDGSLFMIEGDTHLWEKSGNKAVRSVTPTEKEVTDRGGVIRENAARKAFGQLLWKSHPLSAKSIIGMNMLPERVVAVRYIPGGEEIRNHFTRLLQEPSHHIRIPSPILLAFEREEQLLAEKARNNDQSPMPRNPSELEEHRILDYDNVPMSSFFVTTTKAHPNSMVYLKLNGDACETVCTYEEWEKGLTNTTVLRKPVKYSDIKRFTPDRKIVPVTVISALTPEEVERLISEHHTIMTKEKRTVDGPQLAFDDAVRAQNHAFWNQAA